MINGAAQLLLPDQASLNRAPNDPIAAPMMDRRGPRSLRKPATEAAEDPDTDTGDSDETEIVDAGEEVRDGADGALANPNFVGTIARQPGGDQTSAFVESVDREGVTDFAIDTAGTGTPTTVWTESGRTVRVRLAPGERSREVKVGAETVLVLDSELSAAEAQSEVAEYIAERFGEIAKRLGLRDVYLPFLAYLFENGFELLGEYYGALGMPLDFISQVSWIWKEDRTHDRRASRLLADHRSDHC